jgi:NAD(P)-dependent dehydrogenase (short-subunit alcohol dehydrogenase family)
MASITAPKVALVTAGSAGLGAAIARTLAIDCGMSVVINYAHNATRAASLVETLHRETAGSNSRPKPPGSPQQTFHAIAADLQRPSEAQRLVAETLAITGGRLDTVISNVGWTRMTDFLDLEQGVAEDDWDRCFDVNVKSHLRLFHAARHALEAATDGVFISTASVAGVKPSGSSLVCFFVVLSPCHFFFFIFLLTRALTALLTRQPLLPAICCH